MAEIEQLKNLLGSCLDSIYHEIKDLPKELLLQTAADLHSFKLIKASTNDDLSYLSIFGELKNGFQLFSTQKELESYCNSIISVFESRGEPLAKAATKLENLWRNTSEEKGITFIPRKRATRTSNFGKKFYVSHTLACMHHERVQLRMYILPISIIVTISLLISPI